MSVQESKEKPEELNRAEKLTDDGKFEEALSILKNFEEKGGVSPNDIVLSHLIKCDLLLQYGLINESVKFAEQTYTESLELGKNLLSVDALVFMAESLIRLSKYDDAFDVNEQGEEILHKFKEKLTSEYKRREASIAFIKGKIGFHRSEADRSIECIEHSLVLREEHSPKKEFAISLSGLAWAILNFKGELNRALKYAERSLAISKESNNKYQIGSGFLTLAVIYSYIGDLNSCISFNEQSLAIYKEINNKRSVSIVLNNLVDVYRRIGDLDRALEDAEQILVLRSEVGDLKSIAEVNDFIIQILIDKGDIERAQQYIHDFEQLAKHLEDKQVNLWYRFSKALLLKTSPRARNRVKAEEIFKNILEEEDLFFGYTVKALLNLCDLLLMELHTINEIEVLEEIDSYITQLLDIAEKSQSYWILCETHLLQAKLSLLTLNIKKAERFLTQAQQIAERFNLNQLISKITDEKEDLAKKLDLWEKLKEVGAPMADRFELSRLNEQISGMVRKRPALNTEVTEEKVAIHKEKKICLVCRGEVLRFTYICECGAIYCDNCARALTNLENMCWVCDVPIDYSKPVKPYKDEVERLEVNSKGKNKEINRKE